MSNFDFLKDYDEKLYKSAINVENNVTTSPAAVKTYATPFLQRVLELLMAEIGKKFDSNKKYYYQLDAVYREGKIGYDFKDRIYGAYQLRNKLHDDIDVMKKSEVLIAQQLHEKLFYIAKKLYRDFYPGYKHYEGIPDFKPIEIDTSKEEVGLIKIPDFSQINDIDYDYCIICGEPNHSNYSLCCEKCNRIMDNANNFISIRNNFGKDSRLTKEDLIEYGIPEGYVNQLVHSMVQERMLEVKGRYITFNSMYLDDYLTKIDNYISICELITKFRDDKLTPSEIKKTREYILGSRKEQPFHQFYKIVNREIRIFFENYLLTNGDIWKTIDYSAITQEQLKRWYEINLGSYHKGKPNESFLLFNDLLIKDYLDLASQGILEAEIRKRLNVSDEVYGFWFKYDVDFERKLKDIKIDLLSRAIQEGKTKGEVLEYAGVTLTEYENLIKFSNFKDNEFSRLRNEEIESRKREFVKYLYNFDLRIACAKAKFSVDDFYEYYDNADAESQFYVKSTRMLMDKYLLQRRYGKTKSEAIERVGIKEKYLQRWLSRSDYSDFKDEDLRVTIDLIIRGFKRGLPLEEIAETAGVSTGAIRGYIKLGERGSEIYRPLFEYYEDRIISQKISRFIEALDTKSIRKALEVSKLTDEEANKYYELGRSGDERYNEFYDRFFKAKRATYLLNIEKGKSHKIAMRESWYSEEEYEQNKDDLDTSLDMIKQIIVLEEIKDNKTSNVAASKANVTVDDIYEWYFKGKEGQEEYVKFYEAFHGGYVRPNINAIQSSLDSSKSHLDNLIKTNKKEFTKRDVEIWVKNGLLDNKVLTLNINHEDEEDKEDKESKFNANEMLMEMGVEDYDRIAIRKNTSSSGILSKKDQDVEKLKKEIMKK